MIDWYLSLNLGFQIFLGILVFLVGKIIIVSLFSLIQLLFAKSFGRPKGR